MSLVSLELATYSKVFPKKIKLNEQFDAKRNYLNEGLIASICTETTQLMA